MQDGVIDAAVVGAGPAGLAAAEMLCATGLRPVVFDAKPSVGRKFLMAGKSGLNLTMNEPADQFAARICCKRLDDVLADFGPQSVLTWTRGLGEEIFTGSSGRVFPVAMKASPMLRKWLRRLSAAGAEVRTRWAWTGWTSDGGLRFERPEGPTTLRARVTVLALGGASWPRLGSDASWVPWLSQITPVHPFRPANMGFDVAWSSTFAERFAGTPVKTVGLSIAERHVKGEFVVTRTGIEGSAIYALSASLRDALEAGPATLAVDLLPDREEGEIRARLARPRGKTSWANHLRRTLRLQGVKAGLLREGGSFPPDPGALAARIKATAVHVARPRPIEEAISSAGGVAWDGLTQDLMLTARPGVFVAGEMLDWEAPTGGYLITTCLATGRRAGKAAAEWALKSG